MPYKEFGSQLNFKPDNNLPLDLEHKPLYAMPYQRFDGIYKTKTDARYLSVGLAQWGHDDISLKIMRFTGDKWSRQAEELPLHRVFDSAIFLAKVLFDNEYETVEVERKTFEEQNAAFQVKKENTTDVEQKQFDEYLEKNGDLLKRRLNSLYHALDGLKSRGKF